VPDPPSIALRLSAVDLDRPGRRILSGVDWTVERSERWVVIGPNGSGKTTLIQLACGYLHPTRGTVDVLGARLGRVDVRRLRRRIGLVSDALAGRLPPSATVAEVVAAGARGALEPWWGEPTAAEAERAADRLAALGAAHLAARELGSLSAGERQAVLVARALTADPGLLLLDEPAAGLDLGGRERLVSRLDALAADPAQPPTVLVTHHVEEIPPSFTHALVLSAGSVLAAGPLPGPLRPEVLSAAFGMALCPRCDNGRWSCVAGSGQPLP
jgi:iron complex transport system ATP-binding protein